VLQQADALLIHLQDSPVFSATIPSKTQAYLALGRPILVGVRGDASELVQRADAGVACEPGDPSSIAEAAIRLAETPADRLAEMGRHGAEFYRREISIAAGVDRFECAFRSIVGKNGSK
jgi:colanic acid biosynthesis glycosyl transferase WcaI